MPLAKTYIGDTLVATGQSLMVPYERPSNYPAITEPTASEDKVVMLCRVFRPVGTDSTADIKMNLTLSGSSVTVTASPSNSATYSSDYITFDYDNATSYAIDINAAVSGTSYYIDDLGNTSQADWNTLAGTSGETYVAGDSFIAAAAGSTLSDTTGKISVYNFRHVVVTITGANNFQSSYGSRNFGIEELYLSVPSYNSSSDYNLDAFNNTNDHKKEIRYFKIYNNFSSITGGGAYRFLYYFEQLVEFDCPADFLPNVTSLKDFFSYCRRLTKTTVFDTSGVTDFHGFYQGCTLPFLNWDFSDAVDMSYAFNGAYGITVVPDLSLPNCTNASYMFYRSSAVEIGDVSVPSATNAKYLFSECFGLKTVGTVTITSATNCSYLFEDCYSIKTIKNIAFSSTASAINCSFMYNKCYSLTKAFIPQVPISRADYMFTNCAVMSEVLPAGGVLDLSATTNRTYLRNVFYYCYGLERLPDTKFSTSSSYSGSTSSIYFVRYAQNLREIPAIDFSAATAGGGSYWLYVSATKLVRCRMTGMAQNVYFRTNDLSVDAIDEIFTNLATVTSKTINVADNPGSSGCDTTIATNKGWTVTT